MRCKDRWPSVVGWVGGWEGVSVGRLVGSVRPFGLAAEHGGEYACGESERDAPCREYMLEIVLRAGPPFIAIVV